MRRTALHVASSLARVAASLALAGCGLVTSPVANGPQPLPSAAIARPGEPPRGPHGGFLYQLASGPVVPGVIYRLSLFPHCGFTPTSIDFDGSYWDPVPGHNVTLREPGDVGTIQLLGPRGAVYTAAGGGRIQLVRGAPGPRESIGCD